MNRMRAILPVVGALLLESGAVLSENANPVQPSRANDSTSNATVATIAEKISAYSAPFVSHDASSWSNDVGQALVVSAVVVGGAALAGIFIWLLAPVFGYKFCSILGNCGSTDGNDGDDGVSANGGEDASAAFPFPIGYRYNGAPYAGYRKRSLRYVGPILKMLSSAYEKYEEFSSTTPKSE